MSFNNNWFALLFNSNRFSFNNKNWDNWQSDQYNIRVIHFNHRTNDNRRKHYKPSHKHHAYNNFRRIHFWFDHNNTTTTSSLTESEAKTPEFTYEGSSSVSATTVNTLSESETTTKQESITEESNWSLVTNGLTSTQSSNTASTKSTTD